MIYTPEIWRSIAIIVAGVVVTLAARAFTLKRLGVPGITAKAQEIARSD